jgi:cytosine/uracil/thiamine/allantoin permease
MLTKIIKLACIGFLIGAVIGNLIAILTGTSGSGGITFASKQLLDMSGGSPVIAMILQSVFSGLYGALCFIGIAFYDIERLPLALATSAHCALIILTFIPISLFLGWTNDIISVLIIASVQFIAFFIIWLIMYLVYKKQVKELNELQSKLNKEESED